MTKREHPVPTRLRTAAASERGPKHARNEDCFVCKPEEGIFVVVDGVGGRMEGDKAAEIAADIVYRRLLYRSEPPHERLRHAIVAANNEIYRQAQKDDHQQPGMACVLTAMLMEDDRVFFGHVGDTRLYQITGEAIEKLTVDHSVVGALEDKGLLTEEEAMLREDRNKVTRIVGGTPHGLEDDDFVFLGERDLTGDSAWLLCSDGLTDQVTAAALQRTLYAHADAPNEAAKTLIDKARKRGGRDDITIIIVEEEGFTGEHAAPSTPRRTRKKAGPKTGTVRLSWRLRLFFVMIAVLVLAVLFLWQGSAFMSKTWNEFLPRPKMVLQVSPQGDQDYASIGAALAVARHGDVVLVHPGTYTEQVVLKDSVMIVGAIPGSAVIAGGATDSVLVSGVGVQQVGLYGLVLDPATQDSSRVAIGLLLRDAVFHASDLTVRGARDAALVIEGNATGTVHASRIEQNPGGGVVIRVAGAGLSLQRNVIRFNGTNDAGHGVVVEAGAALVLNDNLIYANRGYGLLVHTSPIHLNTWETNNTFVVGNTPNEKGAVRLETSPSRDRP